MHESLSSARTPEMLLKKSTRRAFFAAAAATGTFAIVKAPARAADFEFKSAHALPTSHPMHVRSVECWEQVAKETNGRLVVKVFPSGSLGGQSSLIQQLRVNAIQMVSIINSAYADFIPAAGIDSVGFAFKGPQAAWPIVTGALGDYMRKEFEAKGLYIPKGGVFDLGMRQIINSKKPVRTAADFDGLKLRVPPAKITIDLFRTLGASPITGSGEETYTSMQTRLIDGAEVPYLTIESQKLYEVQKFISVTNHMWTGESYVMNLEAWKSMPADLQAIAERNVAKYCLMARNDSWQQNSSLAEKLRSQGLTFNDADTQSMRTKLTPYYGRWKSELGTTLWGLLESGAGKLG